MKIKTTNGSVEIFDIIPYSLVKKYTREVTKIAVSLGIDGQSPDEVQKRLMNEDEDKKTKTVEFGFALEDAKEELVRKCILSFTRKGAAVQYSEGVDKAIEEYEITPSDIEDIATTIMAKIEEQNAKKKDTPNTSEASPTETSE
jgi:hypothetical protein